MSRSGAGPSLPSGSYPPVPGPAPAPAPGFGRPNRGIIVRFPRWPEWSRRRRLLRSTLELEMSLGPFLHPFSPPGAPEDSYITIARGEGAVVYDAAGKAYVDGMASLWYAALGHGRTEIADAVARQLRTVVFNTYAPYTNEPADRLAGRIRDLAPIPEARVFFTSSGSEAVDSAVKLARLAQTRSGHPERTVVVARERAFHGTTYGGTSLQGIAPNRVGFSPLVPDVVMIAPDSTEALAAVFAENEGRVAAFITEPVQGAGGVHPPAPGYLQEVRRLCDEHGAFMILDEVICGFGRLGTWFAADYYGVTPDLMTFAKAITSGYFPLGGVIVGRAIREPLEADEAFVLRHGFTYSGHPGGCAAGLVCLDLMEREGLLERAVTVGGRLEKGFRDLAARGLVAEVRGAGAVWGVALHDHHSADEMRTRLLSMGAIARPVPGNTLAYCPPLVITDAQVDYLIETLSRVVG
jgi:putrescine aminotransferase